MGHSFNNPIELNVYEIKDKESLNYPEIGFIIKQFRKFDSNRKKVIFHRGKTIYSSDIIDDSSSKIKLNEVYNHSLKDFSSKSEEDRFILKLYIGELVAFNLRKFRENWRISNRGNTVFQALRNDNWELIGDAISCEAFEYEPIIFEDGSFSLIIEPKHRLFMNYTLRIEDFQNKLAKASHIIDYCPIECIEKTDPYTLCKLSNPEYLCSKKDIKQVNKKPTNYLITKDGKDYNIKEYSNLDIICPRTDKRQRLGDFLKDIEEIIEDKRFLNDEIK